MAEHMLAFVWLSYCAVLRRQEMRMEKFSIVDSISDPLASYLYLYSLKTVSLSLFPLTTEFLLVFSQLACVVPSDLRLRDMIGLEAW